MTDFIQNDPDIETAHKEYEKFLSDEHLQHLYMAREMYRHDEATRIANAEENGIKKGTKKIILNLQKNGFTLKQISEMTGIPETEINGLLK